MNVYRRQRGYLLITVVVTLFLLATISMLLAYDSSNNAHNANSELEAARAEYVARAGLHSALWRAENNACMGDVTIPATALGNDTFDATISGASAGNLVVVDADQDAWIRNDDTDKNNGTDSANHVKYDGGNIEQVLTRFDVSTVAANAQINSAVAWFHLKSGKDHPEGHITVHEIAAGWDETTVTWDTFSGADRPAEIAAIPAQETGDIWVAINITGLVQAWVNGQPNYGILFNSTAEGLHTEYTARADGSNPPRLEVVIGSGAASPLTIKARGKLGNGVDRNLKDYVATAYQPPATVVLQPGAEGKDGWVRSGSSNNYGVAGEMTISGGANPKHFLIQFPFERIPRGIRVISARMEVYLNWLSSSDPTAAFSAHGMTQPWAEGSGDNWNPGDGANWNTSDGSETWDWQTNHDAAVAVDTTVVDPSYTGWHTWDITDLAQQWVAGTRSNYGVVIKGNDNALDAWFRSSDYADPANHPRLIIEYACECGSPCVPFGGSGRIAFIGDDNSPNAYDELKIQLFESWGYDVDFYQDRLSDWVNWSNYDVAYVSETVVASDMAADLANAAIGIVNEERRLYNDLELSNGSTENVGSSIDITDNSHFITSVFPAGPLSIYTGDMEVTTADLPLADGLQTLGEFGGAATVTALEKGAITTGGTAPGRRATVPLGQHVAANFDWQHVNANGLLLVNRAIEWARGSPGATGDTPLLFVVVNPDNLTAQESLKTAMLESWGYAVSLIDESDSAEQFEKFALNVDVIFVSEDVSSGNVGSKLNNVTTGIVIEEANLADDLGFADGIDWGSGVKLSIDNNFYITSPFPSGSVAVLTTTESLAYLTGAVSPDAKVLGGADSGPALVTLSAGAQLVDGGTSPGRRVLLPWGGDSMDMNSLNDDGISIFQRALEWAAGNEPGFIAHWKLDDAAGLIAIDSEGGHHGTLQNGPTWSSGTIDGALDFDGTDDYVDLTSDNELTDIFGGGATVTGWIYLRSWGESDNGRILDKANQVSGDRDGWMIGVRGATPALQFAQGFTGVRGFWRSEDGTVALNSWVHFAVVYDASSVDNDAKIYLDGVEQSPLVEITPTGSIATDAGISLRMGNYAHDTSRTFDGIIDDVRIYGRLLASAEIEELAERLPAIPVAHWKLDETSGTVAEDSAGDHDGTTSNTTWVPGKVDGGLLFNSSSDSVTVPHADELSITDTLTVSAWIYKTGRFGYDPAIAKATTGSDLNYFLGTWESNPVFGFSTSSDGWQGYYATSTTLSEDTWYHLAATFDDAADMVKVYVDGTLAQSFPTTLEPVTNSGNVFLGRSAISEYWPGTLDDVRIYDRVLDAAEIASVGAGGGGNPGGGGVCDGTFRDEFDARSFTGSDGTLTWATDWIEVGESDGPTSGDIQVQTDQSNYQLRTRDNNNGGEGVEREVDLTGASTATLSYDYRRMSLDSTSDYTKVEVSTDGTSWTELVRHQGGSNDSSYQPATHDISGYISSTTRIRFLTSSSMGNTDTVWFDNVEIQCTP